ncbi:MAG: hypothetical protein CME28_01110 [Gemmatimonadetes bacterium]|nr:hypothetical protein [Gemmatimonadota bacterium]
MSSAIGVLETCGMASLVNAADAMLKVSDVKVTGRHGIGSGWVTVVIEGSVADVQTAIAVGEIEAQRYGELISSEIIARPDERAQAAMPHGIDEIDQSDDQRALGLIETQGMAPIIAGADAMVKAAAVDLCGWAFIGGALCHAVVRGDVAAVYTAVEAGRRAATDAGKVYATLVLPQPIAGVAPLLPCLLEDRARSGGALGVVETIGYTTVVAVSDAMVKAADVEVERLSIGSGGRIAVLAVGGLDDVQAAVAAGREEATAVGELDGLALLSRPDAMTMRCFAGAFDGPRVSTVRRALGLIETRSTVGLVSAVDQMLKAADVEYEGSYKVGYFLTASAIRGDVGAVRVAIEAGAQEAQAHGELVSAHVIPQLYGDVERRLLHS